MKRYNTPHRSRVVKTRLSEDEYADFTARLAPYGISQSEFLRQAIRRTTIRPVIHVSAVNDELLSAVGKLAAEYGRIGGNLNQIARYLNVWTGAKEVTEKQPVLVWFFGGGLQCGYPAEMQKKVFVISRKVKQWEE